MKKKHLLSLATVFFDFCLFTWKFVFVQKLFLLIFFSTGLTVFIVCWTNNFCNVIFINEFNIWQFCIVKQQWISQMFINVIQFIDTELFRWIYFYLFTTVLIELQINFAVKYGFLVNFKIFKITIIRCHTLISTLFSGSKPDYFTSNFLFE